MSLVGAGVSEEGALMKLALQALKKFQSVGMHCGRKVRKPGQGHAGGNREKAGMWRTRGKHPEGAGPLFPSAWQSFYGA